MTLDFERLTQELAKDAFIQKLTGVLGENAYLVGGFIRDCLIGRRANDIDLVIAGDFESAVKRASSRLGVSAFSLGERFCSKRLSLPGKTIDFAPVYGSSIVEDLLRRDFGINALAVPLTACGGKIREEVIVDPSGGLIDLAKGEISAVSEKALIEDPVRILRAFRFMAELEFKLEEITETLLQLHADELTHSPGERIREELLFTLNQPNCFPALKLMDELGILEVVFPELTGLRGVTQNEYHHLPVYEHSLECVRELEVLFHRWEGIKEELHQPLAEHLSEVVNPPGTRFALTKLALILHDVGKPLTREEQTDGKITFHGHQKVGRDLAKPALERLRMGTRERDLILLLIEEHLRVGFYCNEVELTPKLIYRYENKLGDATVMGAVHALADARATRGTAGDEKFQATHTQVVNEILWHHFFDKGITSPSALLDGNEIMDVTGFPPGPVIGRLKETLLEAQVEGEITTREEAISFVREAGKKLSAMEGA